jgi:Protein of unknown function (DUF3303)
MLYVAFYKNKPGVALKNKDVMDKSRKWWNEGGKPKGMKTVAVYGALGSDAPNVIVFETDSHDDIRKMISFWRDTTDFQVYPGIDLAADFRKQGMKVS